MTLQQKKRLLAIAKKKWVGYQHPVHKWRIYRMHWRDLRPNMGVEVGISVDDWFIYGVDEFCARLERMYSLKFKSQVNFNFPDPEDVI